MATVERPANQRKQTFDVVGRFAFTREQGEILDALATSMFGGNRAAVLRYLLDLHAGRVQQELDAKNGEQEMPSFNVVRFSRPRLSVEVIQFIAGSIAAGLPRDPALDLAGVTTKQRKQWWTRGASDRAEGRASLHADYVTAVLQAEAMQKQENIQVIRRHRENVWTAAAWLLDRVYPDEFGERKRVDSKVQHQLLPMIVWEQLSVPEARQLVYLMRKASPENSELNAGRHARPAADMIPADIADAVDVVDGEAEEIGPTVIEAGPEAPALEKPPG